MELKECVLHPPAQIGHWNRMKNVFWSVWLLVSLGPKTGTNTRRYKMLEVPAGPPNPAPPRLKRLEPTWQRWAFCLTFHDKNAKRVWSVQALFWRHLRIRLKHGLIMIITYWSVVQGVGGRSEFKFEIRKQILEKYFGPVLYYLTFIHSFNEPRFDSSDQSSWPQTVPTCLLMFAPIIAVYLHNNGGKAR